MGKSQFSLFVTLISHKRGLSIVYQALPIPLCELYSMKQPPPSFPGVKDLSAVDDGKSLVF